MFARFSSRNMVLGLVVFALIGAARPAAAADPSPSAILLAKQLVEIKGVKTMFAPIVRGVVIKVRDMFLQTNFMFSKDLNDSAAAVDKDYESRANELVDATARIYAAHFTESELKGMLAFYQSPLGQKLLIEEPKAINESMVNASKWADDLSTEVISKMREEMKKRGHDM